MSHAFTTIEQSISKGTSFAIQGSIIAFNVIIGIMVMYAAFTMLPVRERSLGVKTMQNCSGAPIWLMWLAQYVWDFLNCLPSIALTLIIFAASQKVEGMKTFVETLDVIFVLFLFFTLAMLPFGYCWSFMFDTAASALTYC